MVLIKLLYLAVGLMLKQTMDEFKELWREHAADLRRKAESLATYRPNPAIEAGSREHVRAMAELQHRQVTEAEVSKLLKRARRVKSIPVIGYAVLTFVLIALIIYFESTAAELSAPPSQQHDARAN